MGCLKRIVMIMTDKYRHAERSYVMLNVVACNRIQHLLYRGDSGASPE